MTDDHADLQVPGYRIEGPVAGADGEAWLGVAPGGDAVSLRLLPLPATLAERDRLRRRLAALTAFRHPHVARLRTVVTTPRGLVLVHDWVDGVPLGDLLAAAGRLSPGQLVTLAAPLAQALTALHSSGAAHGAVAARSVVLDREGRPFLIDMGAGEAGGDATAAGDVAALAALCVEAVNGAPAPLAELLTAAADPDPTRRPSAGALATALLAACPAQPLHPAAPRAYRPPCPPQPEGGSRRAAAATPTHAVRRHSREPRHRAPQRVGVLVTLPVLVLLAAGAGVVWAEVTQAPRSQLVRAVPAAGSSAQTTSTGPAASPAHPPVAAPGAERGPQRPQRRSSGAWPQRSWHGVVKELDRRRSAAFATGDARLLRTVYQPGSAPLRRDLRRLGALSAAGARAEGVRLLLKQVRMLRKTPAAVVLQVVDRLPPYSLTGSAGQLLARRDGRGSAAWTLLLDRGGAAEWRIAEITRVADERLGR